MKINYIKTTEKYIVCTLLCPTLLLMLILLADNYSVKSRGSKS